MLNEDLKNAILNGNNILLTGNAGAGKTFQTNLVKDFLSKNRIPYAVTASTGYASTHVKGSTIHSFIGMKTESNPMMAKKIVADLKPNKRQIIKEKRFIFIDEISMISSNQVDLISNILKEIHNTDKPFGGVQMMLIGDFFQLPPVIKNDKENKQNHWAFKAQDFINGNFKVINLKEVKRQNDNDFIEILNEARLGNLSEKSIVKLFSRQIKKFPEDCIRLYGTNSEVDKDNEEYLATLKSELEEYKGIVSIDEKYDVAERGQIFFQIVNGSCFKLDLKLKSGCRVMLRENALNGSYVNGSTGTYLYKTHVFDVYMIEKYSHLISDIISFGFQRSVHFDVICDDKSDLPLYVEIKPEFFEKISNSLIHGMTNGNYNIIPQDFKLKVKLDNGEMVYVARKTDEYNFSQEYNEAGEPIYDASYTQFPLTLAKAITSHKSQGCTLDKVFIDFYKMGQDGQGYVVLSRVKSIDGLFIKNFDSRKVKANKEVLQFYKQMGEL